MFYDTLFGLGAFLSLWWIGLWLVLTIVVAVIADERGRSGFFWFITALLFSPPVAVLLLIASPDRAREQREKAERDKAMDNLRQGFDALAKRLDALQVAVVRSALAVPSSAGATYGSTPVETATSQKTPLGASPAEMGYCPGCKRLRASNSANCIYCGNTDATLQKS